MLQLLTSYGNQYMGYGMRGGFYGFDWTYLLVLIGLGISLLAQARVSSAYSRYAKVMSSTGMTGELAAEAVLRSQGIYDVRIEHVSGSLTDHYDPRTKTLRLSDATYGARSVAAVCIAAHECGHAVQDQVHYGPLVLRSTLVPAAGFGSRLAMPVFLAGLILSIRPLLTVGILLFSLAVLFQLVTLPVEFNASSRALRILQENNMLNAEEMEGGRKVLGAAALTYVAALLQSLLQLFRLIILAGNRGGKRRG